MKFPKATQFILIYQKKTLGTGGNVRIFMVYFCLKMWYTISAGAGWADPGKYAAVPHERQPHPMYF